MRYYLPTPIPQVCILPEVPLANTDQLPEAENMDQLESKEYEALTFGHTSSDRLSHGPV